MKKEFIVERQGKAFVLFAGILDLAHQQGLKSIETFIVQIPTAENKQVAICSARVVLEKDGIERSFTGIGDASPANVAPAMKDCLLRMAETRSKARAMRDAVNVGVVAFEELGEEDAFEVAPPVRSTRAAAATPQTVNGNIVMNTASVQCAVCHAPPGKAHVRTCASVLPHAAKAS